ncbi:MAG: hypothetical protein J4G09_13490 [Proteobacteria bacterium]|nr:hypothetical protein [Pseudomonadota bacterium]
MPCAGLVTRQFKGLAQATARGRRVPELPVLVLPQGYDEWPEERIRADARERLPALLDALTGAGD